MFVYAERHNYIFTALKENRNLIKVKMEVGEIMRPVSNLVFEIIQ